MLSKFFCNKAGIMFNNQFPKQGQGSAIWTFSLKKEAKIRTLSLFISEAKQKWLLFAKQFQASRGGYQALQVILRVKLPAVTTVLDEYKQRHNYPRFIKTCPGDIIEAQKAKKKLLLTYPSTVVARGDSSSLSKLEFPAHFSSYIRL